MRPNDLSLNGPERYSLTFDHKTFQVKGGQGSNGFSGIAATKGPKIYVLSNDDGPFYVGAARRKLQPRFRDGWNARGRNGYHGYAWRKVLTSAELWVWAVIGGAEGARDMQTIEAEVVFLIRASGQWPLHQTEIHFHPSTAAHRTLAVKIVEPFNLSTLPKTASRRD